MNFYYKEYSEECNFCDSIYGDCRDPSLGETRGTHLPVTRGTCYHPNHHHPDSPKQMHDDGSPIRTASRKGKGRFNFS